MTRSVAIVLLAGLAALAPAQDVGRGTGTTNRRTPVVEAVERAAPAVVNISTKRKISRMRRHPLDAFFEFQQPEERGGRLVDSSLGSGVIVDAKGYVVTNDHVVRQADQISVGLSDGRIFEARVVGKDSDNDIAILEILGEGPFPTVTLADSNDFMIGETTVAMGNPFGLGGSVTTGVLSAVGRTVEFRGRKVFEDFLQTSAVINPGNSGGALLNLDGELMGVNVAIHNRGPGIGFAIPCSRIREVLYRLLDPRMARRTWIGIEVAHDREVPGALVTAVHEDSPAAAGGLVTGDLVVSLDGREVDNWIDFQTTLDSLDVGAEVALDVRRGDRSLKKVLRVVEAPPSEDERAAFAMLGFTFTDLDPAMKKVTELNEGVVVTEVEPESPAARRGLQAGDLIYQIGNFAVRDQAHALEAVRRYVESGYRGIKVSLYRPSGDANMGGEIPFARPPERRRLR